MQASNIIRVIVTVNQITSKGTITNLVTNWDWVYWL